VTFELRESEFRLTTERKCVMAGIIIIIIIFNIIAIPKGALGVFGHSSGARQHHC